MSEDVTDTSPVVELAPLNRLPQRSYKAGVHISHVQRIEAGTSQPTVDVLRRLAEALNISLDFLVFDRVSETAAQRLADTELVEQFAAVERFEDGDKQAVKKVIAAMIVKQRVEAAVR